MQANRFRLQSKTSSSKIFNSITHLSFPWSFFGSALLGLYSIFRISFLFFSLGIRLVTFAL